MERCREVTPRWACALLLLGCATDLHAQIPAPDATELLTQAGKVVMERRATPLELSREGNARGTLLKLTADSLVLTIQPDQAGEKPFHLLVETCDVEGSTIFYDGTLLQEGESAQQFWDHNLTFLLARDEVVSYTICLREGMSMNETSDVLAPRPEKLTFDSPARAIRHLAAWAKFLAPPANDPARAAEFLLLSLEKQRESLLEVVTGREIRELAYRVKYFDSFAPIAILDTPLPLDAAQKTRLRSYLETMIYARRKLSIFYPEQRPLLEKEKLLLQGLQP